MKRALISFLLIGLHTLLLTIALRIPVAANTQQQTVAQPGEPTAAPVTISVRQQLPLTITIQRSDAVTPTTSLTETVAVTLDLQFDLTVTDTVTTTVPSTVTVTFADQQTSTVAVSLTVALSPTAAVRVTVPTTAPSTTLPITATDALTTATAVTPTASLTPTLGLTTSLTPTLGLTTTVPPQVLNPTVVSSVAITTNLRSGPDTTFAVQTRIGPGTEILVVAQNVDGTWYLLNNGLWLAAFLVDTPPANLPVATEDLVTILRERNPITPTVPILSTPTLTTTAAVTATEGLTATDALTSALPVTDDLPATGGTPILVPTPVPAAAEIDAGDDAAPDAATEEGAPTAEETGTTAAADEPPSATVDANLRSGPGTTFDVVGGTVTGQALTIVARNEDGSWFLLDNGGWVAAFLIANAPDAATVPLFDGNTPADVVAGETITPTAPVTTTPVTSTAVPTPTFGVQENLYVIRADGITDRYDFALTQAETLIAQAQTDATLLENQEWIIQMTTMITLLRSAGDELASLTPPPLFADAHAQLLQAVAAYNTAADRLAEGIDQLEIETLTGAIEQINTGDQAVSLAQATIDTLTP